MNPVPSGTQGHFLNECNKSSGYEILDEDRKKTDEVLCRNLEKYMKTTALEQISA